MIVEPRQSEGDKSRWPILAILCVLASLLVPGIAPASAAFGIVTRVRILDLADQPCVGAEASLMQLARTHITDESNR